MRARSKGAGNLQVLRAKRRCPAAKFTPPGALDCFYRAKCGLYVPLNRLHPTFENFSSHATPL